MRSRRLFFLGASMASIMLLSGCSFITGESQIVGNEIAQDEDSTETTDTNGWKIYQNKEHGFEFRYPTTWELNVLPDERLALKPLGKKGYEYVGDILITIYPKNPEILIKEFYSEKSFNPFEMANFSINNVGNRDIYLFENFPGMVPNDLYIFFIDAVVFEFNVYNSQNVITELIIESIKKF